MKGIVFILTLLLSACQATLAQTIMSTNKKALKLYDQGRKLQSARDFEGAIARYNEAIKKDSAFAEAYRQAGAAYSVLNQPEQALPYYRALARRFPEVRQYRGAHLKLAEAALAKGYYLAAKGHITKYLALSSAKDKYYRQAKSIAANCDFALERIGHPLSFNPRPLSFPLNQFRQQYFPVLSADLKTLFFIKREKSEEIFTSSRLSDNSWSVPVPIDSAITSEYNEGTCSVSADGRTLVFTSCMRNDGFGSCDLYITHKTGKGWSKPKNMGRPINSSAWDSQPALSADGRTLYYVSNRRGGLGKRDIWVSYFSEETGWSTPKNLGHKINTREDDISPFIHVNDRVLYFASDGRIGFGGFDIYYAGKDPDTGWQEPLNFGYPINTHNDELAMYISADGSQGFYSHETIEQGNLISKLYQIDIPQQISIEWRSSFIKGIVYDSITTQPVAATVALVNLTEKRKKQKVSSDPISGEYLMVLTEGATYALYVTANGYLFNSYHFDLDQQRIGMEGITANIALKPILKGEKTTLNNVFFDFDSFNLTEKSKKALLFVVEYINNNSGLDIEIAGHTDNIGTTKYNNELSEKRAFAVYNYLVSSGVGPGQITYVGYGSSQPIESNETAAGRAKNRRIELVIIE